jgi:hypothetical protein
MRDGKQFMNARMRTGSHKRCNLMKKSWPFVVYALLLLGTPQTAVGAMETKLQPEEAQFIIYLDGKEIGQEKFSIAVSGDTINSHSVVEFRNLGSKRQKVQLESQLSMDSFYQPKTYQLRTNVDGQRGTINGTLRKGEAIFEYRGSGNPRQRGLLVGDSYIVLDTNIFHHFIFIARLFDLSTGKEQSIEVAIPQELDGGFVKIREAGIDRQQVRGKKMDLHHLKADTGLLQIDLWVDDQRTLFKIAVPVKKIEVLRK